MASVEAHPVWRRVLELPLALHVVVLLILLCVVALVVRPAGQFSVDEGISAIQGRTIAETGGWTIDDPMSTVDPDGDAFGLRSAERGADGYVAYARHPLYPVVLSGADRVGGVSAMAVASLAGTAAAATAAALLARRLHRSIAVPTLYITGLASPLLFDSTLLLAHTVAAAAVGFGAVAVARHIESNRRVSWWLLLVIPCAAVVPMLRTEGLILLAAAGAVAGVWFVVDRSPRSAILVAAAVFSSGLAVAIDRGWHAAILGSTLGLPQPPGASSGTSTGSLVRDRVEALVTTSIRTRYGRDEADVLLLAALGALVVALYGLHRARPNGALRAPALVAAALAVAWSVGSDVSPVPGLLVACPLIWFGLGSGGWTGQPLARALAGVFGVLCVGVAATQYRQGGGLEWGARYVHVGLPLVIPVAVLGLHRWVRERAPAVAGAVLAGLAVVTASVVWHGIAAQRDTNAFARRLEAAIEAADAPSHLGPADGDGRPIVVSNEFAIPQALWQIYDGRRWLRLRDDEPVDAGGIDPFIAELIDAGIDRFSFVTTDLQRDRPLLGDEVELGADHGIGGWSIVDVCVRDCD